MVGTAKTSFQNFSHKRDASTFDPQQAMKFFDPLRSRKYLFDWSENYDVPLGVSYNPEVSKKQRFGLPRGIQQDRYQSRRASMPLKNIKKVMKQLFKDGRPHMPLEHNQIRLADESELDQSWESEFLQKYGRHEPHGSAFIQYHPVPAFGEYTPTSVNLRLMPVSQVYTSQDW